MNTTMTLKCNKCNAQFEAMPHEFKCCWRKTYRIGLPFNSEGFLWHYRGYVLECKCPNCRCKNYISAEQIPKDVWERISVPDGYLRQRDILEETYYTFQSLAPNNKVKAKDTKRIHESNK